MSPDIITVAVARKNDNAISGKEDDCAIIAKITSTKFDLVVVSRDFENIF